jgi:hypothetical protein
MLVPEVHTPIPLSDGRPLSVIRASSLGLEGGVNPRDLAQSRYSFILGSPPLFPSVPTLPQLDELAVYVLCMCVCMYVVCSIYDSFFFFSSFPFQTMGLGDLGGLGTATYIHNPDTPLA